jgi:hypothetical protein
LERWAAFIEFALQDIHPIENRYFIVVFHNPFIARNAKRIMTADVFDKALGVLNRKLAHVQGELSHTGLQARELAASEVAEIIYFFYHPVCSPLADLTPPRLRLMPSLVATGAGWSPDEKPRPATSGDSGRDNGAE